MCCMLLSGWKITCSVLHILGVLLAMICLWMLGHGVAAVKLIQHVLQTFPSCASIGMWHPSSGSSLHPFWIKKGLGAGQTCEEYSSTYSISGLPLLQSGDMYEPTVKVRSWLLRFSFSLHVSINHVSLSHTTGMLSFYIIFCFLSSLNWCLLFFELYTRFWIERAVPLET